MNTLDAVRYKSETDLQRHNYPVWLLLQKVLQEIENDLNAVTPDEGDPCVYLTKNLNSNRSWPAFGVIHPNPNSKHFANLPMKERVPLDPINENDINELNRVVIPWENYSLGDKEPFILSVAAAIPGLHTKDQNPLPLSMLRLISVIPNTPEPTPT